MNIKNYIFSFVYLLGIFSISFIGCGDEPDCCTIIDTDVHFHYQNQEGENLINSSEAFSETNIKIYYKEEGEFKYQNNQNLDYPKMYSASENGDQELILTVFPSDYYEGNRSTTLIELNQNTIDTLICEFDLDGNGSRYRKGWLNGVEIVDRFMKVKK